MTTDTLTRPELTLDRWCDDVMAVARHNGWLVQRSRARRFPMLTMTCSLPSGDRRIVFANLRHDSANREWLAALDLVAQVARGHVEVHEWMPSDRKAVLEVLR